MHGGEYPSSNDRPLRWLEDDKQPSSGGLRVLRELGGMNPRSTTPGDGDGARGVRSPVRLGDQEQLGRAGAVVQKV